MNNKEIIQRKTKILVTLGPSSKTIKKIIELSKAGSNAFRLNCSHLSENDLAEYINKIRRAEEIIKKPIGVLVDLQGPKIRIGNVSEINNSLKKGDTFIFDNSKAIGNNKRVYLSNNKVYKSQSYWKEVGFSLNKNYGNEKLRLVIPDNTSSYFFLVSKNFDIILNWNRSNYFALAVNILSDKIKLNEK